jgi:hypothetical protein
MIRIGPATLFSALAAALLAAPASAQQPARSEMVPRELVEGLLGTSSSSGLLVGRLPADLPATMVPPGTRVVGGIERSRGGSLAVLTSAQPCSQAAAEMRARLLRDGWTQPMEQPVTRGFVPSGVTGPSGTYCRGTTTVLNVHAVPRQGGGSFLRLERDQPEGNGWNPCAPREGVMAGQHSAELPIPALYAPAGAEQLGGGSSAGGSSDGSSEYELRALVRTTLDARALVDHYAAQLRAAGWSAADPVSVTGMAAQSFRHRSADGRDWQGVLLVADVPGSTSRNVSIRLTTLTKPTSQPLTEGAS